MSYKHNKLPQLSQAREERALYQITSRPGRNDLASVLSVLHGSMFYELCYKISGKML